jgi:type IV fimbrial biogenesis protein FimT
MSTQEGTETRFSAANRAIHAARRVALARCHDRGNMAAMKSPNQGMTLIELMLGLTVLGILVAIAVPSFRGYATASRATAATNSLVTALSLARSEALRRSTIVRVCASADQGSCSGAVNGWSAGWIVFADNDANGSVDANELIQAWPGLDGNMTTTGNAAVFSYTAMGMGQTALSVDIIPPTCVGMQIGRTSVSVSGAIQSIKALCP